MIRPIRRFFLTFLPAKKVILYRHQDESALIIRRDEDGEWPEWALTQIHAWDMTGNDPVVLLDMLSTHEAEGVEPQ